MDGPRLENRITFIAQTNFRDSHRRFGIKRADRRAHIFLVGKTSTGKSTLMGTLSRQDIEAGEGVALFDPHGDLVEKVLTSPIREMLLQFARSDGKG